MSKLKVLNSELTLIDTIDSVLSSSRKEVINSDNTLSFSLQLDDTTTEWINDTNVIGLDDDYFDILNYKKGQAEDGQLTVSVECGHISYRLNRSEYNAEYFAATGTPAQILAAILAATPFTVGTVDFTESTTYSIQQAMSRRALVVQFAELLGGELQFTGFSVSILTQRGCTTPKDLTAGRNINVISKSVDKTTLDNSGNYTTSYECSLIYPMELSLGDVVTMSYSKLSIDVTLRIVSITSNPYNRYEVSFSVSNTVPAIEDAAYEIATTTVTKDKIYNGTRIGPEYGFEAVRCDKKARAYFRSDEMKFQTGDGSGNRWTDKLYYDYDSETGNTELYFNGKFTAEVIEALSAIITPNLYAEKATIAELTVDRLDTSDKIKNYKMLDKSSVGYLKIYDQHIDFISAQYAGDKDGAAQTEQAADRNNAPLYWTDETMETATATLTEWPVTQYKYNEQVKLQLYHRWESTSSTYNPILRLGVGDDLGNAVAEIEKGTDGLYLKYAASGAGALAAGNTVQIAMTDDGLILDGVVYRLDSLNIATNSFQASYGSTVYNVSLTKDADGKITQINTGEKVIPITYNEV